MTYNRRVTPIIDIEYETRTDGLLYPKLSNSNGRESLSPMARRAVDELNEMNWRTLEDVNISGLNETIFEEIADKATEIKLKRIDELKKSTVLSSDFLTRASQLTEIDMTADREATEVIQMYLKKLITDVKPMGYKEMRSYHIS